MSAHVLSFRGVTFFNSTSGTGATNGGASGVLSVSPMVQEVIAQPFPLGVGYVLKAGNSGPAQHTFEGVWRTNNLSGTLAMLNSMMGLPVGTLSDTQWGNFPNCILRSVNEAGPRKLSDEWGYLIEYNLVFEQYP